MNRQTLISIIRTLKEIDVRGYESMNRLVGLVGFFERVLEETDRKEAAQAQENQETTGEAPVIHLQPEQQ